MMEAEFARLEALLARIADDIAALRRQGKFAGDRLAAIEGIFREEDSQGFPETAPAAPTEAPQK